jgi:putative photosynthetic complex assembly protein 2
MNLLLPVSVTISTLVTYMLVEQAAADQASSFTIAGFTVLATLMGLAMPEHWLLVPIPAASLWSWGLKSRRLGILRAGYQACARWGGGPGSKTKR